MEKQTPEEFLKEKYPTWSENIINCQIWRTERLIQLMQEYDNHVNKQPNKEELEKAFNAGYGYRASIRDIVREPEFKEWHNQNIEK